MGHRIREKLHGVWHNADYKMAYNANLMKQMVSNDDYQNLHHCVNKVVSLVTWDQVIA